MRRIELTGLALAGLTLLGLLAALPAAAAEGNGLPQQTMMDCARIPDSAARLACYDRVIMLNCENIKDKDARLACFDRVMEPRAAAPSAPISSAPVASAPSAPVNTGAGQASVQPQAQPPAPPAPPTEAELKADFGLPRTKQPSRKEAVASEPRNVELTVASVGQLAAGKISFTSTDGAVWDQTSGSPPQRELKPGDKVKIHRNFMGGYICQLNRWESVRCRRMQ